jgi:cytoskeletal protein RodZ
VTGVQTCALPISEEFDKLPALVYTRGFVHEMARFLSLDPTQVTRTYLKRFREWKRASDGPPS